MRKIGLLKSFLLVLSMIMVICLNSVTLATDAANEWGDDSTEWEEVERTATPTATITTTPSTTPTLTATTPTTTPSTKVNIDTTDDDDEKVDSLAYTGAESNTAFAVVVVIGLGVAIYSFKKFREYSRI